MAGLIVLVELVVLADAALALTKPGSANVPANILYVLVAVAVVSFGVLAIKSSSRTMAGNA
jgi:hypothetical protein